MPGSRKFQYEKPEYIRLGEAVKVFPFGKTKMREVAEECGALRKYGRCVFINFQIMKDFLESCEYVDKYGR